MDEETHIKLILIKEATYLISFLISLKLIGNKNIPNYMRGFYWYTSVGMAICTMYIFSNNLHIIPSKTYRIINLLSLVFHFLFLSNFIIQVITNNKAKKYLKKIPYFFIPLITYFIIKDVKNNSAFSFAFTNFGLVFFCISYYYQLFKNSPTINLLKEPAFWIITGIFFGMSIIIPLTLIGGYLVNTIPRNIFLPLTLITLLGYGIMHIFFIKGILCSFQFRQSF